MKYTKGLPPPSKANVDINPFAHLAQPQELDSAEIVEIIEDDTTDRIQLSDEFAHIIEEETRKAVINGLGAALDAMRIHGFDIGQCGIIMSCAIELLKNRKIYDLKDFSYSKNLNT